MESYGPAVENDPREGWFSADRLAALTIWLASVAQSVSCTRGDEPIEKGTAMLECQDDYRGACRGEVHEYRSRSGCTVTPRCDKHQDEYNVRMDALHEDINSRYPGYDNPHSSPPEWFDPSYAGESWDGDY